MPGLWFQYLQDNLNIDLQIVYFFHNFAHLLYYSSVNRSCCGHPLCDLSKDRQLFLFFFIQDLKVIHSHLRTTSFELIYPGIRSHLGCQQQDLKPK